ncbi:MAG TPA: ATP-binding protein, partial [Rectinemataceae bacterium]|nr:ATP-binding protein [Rectinemataceae bacterium]
RASGTIAVGLEESAGLIRLSVSDDGVGLGDAGIPRGSTSMGMTLMRMLTEQIGATMRVGSGQGTTIEIEFARDAVKAGEMVGTRGLGIYQEA